MSTCRGTWGDGLPPVPGAVLYVIFPDRDGRNLLAHQPNGQPTDRCPHEGSHYFDECGEFDPPAPRDG